MKRKLIFNKYVTILMSGAGACTFFSSHWDLLPEPIIGAAKEFEDSHLCFQNLHKPRMGAVPLATGRAFVDLIKLKNRETETRTLLKGRCTNSG